jgi:hypothetical protein
MAKSRLQGALAREKGTDFKKLLQKKKHKAALKDKRKAGKIGGAKTKKHEEADEDEDDDWEGVDNEEEEDEEEDSDMAGLIDGEAVEGDSSEEDDEDEDEDAGARVS